LKIAVSSVAPGGLDAQVDPRFGRCAVFTIVDVVDGEIKGVSVVENSAAAAFSGAGIQAAQIVAEQGVEVVISGRFGPNAQMALQQLGVKVVAGLAGMTVREAVKRYLSGQAGTGAGVGIGPGMGPGMAVWGPGMGMGRGMRMGMGRGMGRGMGGGWRYAYTPAPPPTPMPMQPPPMSKEQERQMLLQQLKALEAQLEAIKKRLKELEK